MIMKGKGLVRICTVFLVIVSMLAVNVPIVSAATTFAPVIAVVNNNGSADTIKVTGTGSTTTGAVYAGDKIRVYKVSTSTTNGGTKIAEGVAAAASGDTIGRKATATFTVSQIGAAKGYVYVEVDHLQGDGSTLTKKSTIATAYKAETALGKSPSILTKAPASVTVANYRSQDDVIVIGGQTKLKGALIKLYASRTTRTILETGTIDNDGQLEIKVPNLSSRGGTLYISATMPRYAESARTAVKYESEQSKTLSTKEITVYNYENTDREDALVIASPTTNVTNPLKSGDLIKVYNGIGSRDAIAEDTAGSDPVLEIKIPNGKLASSKSGNLYITRTSSDKVESGKVKVGYKSETVSKGLKKSQVIITNNAYGTADTVAVTGEVYAKVYAATKIFLYQDITGGDDISASTAVAGTAEDIAAGKGVATLTLGANSKDLDPAGGILYVSFKEPNEQESSRIAVSYKAEPKLELDSVTFITVNNAEGSDDTITVSGLKSSNDIVKIYHKDQTLVSKFGVRTLAKAAEFMATRSGNGIIYINQLETVTGFVYATVTPENSIESDIKEVTFEAEDGSDYGLNAGNISMTNTIGGIDTLTVSGLAPNDLLKVYDATGTTELASGMVTTGTSVDLSLVLPDAGTKLQLSLTKFGKPEGKKVLSGDIPAEQ